MGFAGLDLTGKLAVVVGGTTGIGRALTLGLAQAGADVVPMARRAERVEEAASAVEALGRRSLRVQCDVTDPPSLARAREAVLAAFGRVDVLVNSAGRTERVPTLEMADADWDLIIATNLTGTLHACRAFGPHMLERGRGRIINIASLSSFSALFETAAYNVSKAGVAALTKSLAVEWGPRGVNVNAIAPGVFRTALNERLLESTERSKELLLRTPLKRFGRVEELQGAAVYLSSDAASFVNGEVLVVDGGFLASAVNQ
jgi:NAD(P)-dependent dehydrogenase (short-subunit alcohol dehydrogenase family)